MRNRARLNVEELESRLTPSIVVTNERPSAPESYVEGTRAMIMTVIFRETGVETVNIEQFSIDELVNAFPNSPIDRIGLRIAGTDEVFAEMGAEAYEEQTRFSLSGSPLLTIGIGETVRIHIDAWFKKYRDVVPEGTVIEEGDEIYVFPNVSFLSESPAVVARTESGQELAQNNEEPDDGRKIFIGVEPGEGGNRPLRGNPAPFVERTDAPEPDPEPEPEPQPASPPNPLPELPPAPTQNVLMFEPVTDKKNAPVASLETETNTPAAVSATPSVEATEEAADVYGDFRVAPGAELEAQIDEVFRQLWQILGRLKPAKAD